MTFDECVYEVVRKIPKGRVASYGTVACLAGFPRAARQVGRALHRNPDPDRTPCYRVVFADGRLSPAFAFGGENRQRTLLERDGVCFDGDRVRREYFL